MANILTSLAGDLYRAADVISREQVGLIPSVTINGGSERAALNSIIRSFVAPSVTTVSNSPAMTVPEGVDQTISNKTMTLTKSKGVQIPWTGEDVKFLDQGAGYRTVYGAQVEQAMRAITNEIEEDGCIAAYLAASRAYGTSGTTPFGTAGDYTDMAETLKILKDNGAPRDGNSLVFNTTAGAKFLGLQADSNRQGGDSILRQGVLLDLHGNALRESAYIQDHVKGTGTSYTTSTAGFAVGSTTIAIITGTGTVLAGDVVTFAGDANQYVVTTGTSGAGNIVIAAPGLKVALPASAVAMTITNSYAANVLVNRGAMELAIRAPAMPEGGDAAVENMTIVDPRSGIPFDISLYKGFQKSMLNVSAVWGWAAWKPEHIAILKG